MQVTGYQLREALRKWNTKAEIAHAAFKESIWAFEGETKDPLGMAKKCAEADTAVAMIETYQQRYNQLVELDILGRKIPLALAVKSVGFAGRLEKEWRLVAKDNGRERYGSTATQRSKDDIFATKVLTPKQIMDEAEKAATVASALRSAIATGNSVAIEMDVDSELL